MDACEQTREKMISFLDGVLPVSDKETFDKHLAQCVSCREVLEEEQKFINRLRSAKPSHPLPTTLRDQMTLYLQQRHRPKPRAQRLRFGGIAAAVVAILFAVILAGRLRNAAPDDFEKFAAATHALRLRGQLPTELTTESPQTVSAWFVGKIPFRLSLPDYPTALGERKPYEVKGARLLQFKNASVAYVGYEMSGHPISLLVATHQLATPRGGEQIESHGLVFHYRMLQGFKVLTWEDHGLTYAQVSDLGGRGQQSCVICHPGPGDRSLLDGLKVPR